MIELVQGDLLEAKTDALVNAVNTVGVMGAGIALQFRQKYPEMFKAYEQACKIGTLSSGKMHVFELSNRDTNPRWIINFPTKRHWREPSHLTDVISGLTDLVSQVRQLEIQSVAIPPLGCGLGGLDWSDVRRHIEEAFVALPEVHVLLFAPVSAPVATTKN